MKLNKQELALLMYCMARMGVDKESIKVFSNEGKNELDKLNEKLIVEYKKL